MHPYTMQSYFKSLCDAYYIAYENRNRILREDEELKKFDKAAEMKVVEKLKELELTDEIQCKYFSTGFSKDELGEIQRKLQEEQEEYRKKKEKLNKEFSYWKQQMAGIERQMIETIKVIEENGYYIIITSLKQVICLIALFYKNEITGTKVITTDKEFSKIYPQDDISTEFFTAYETQNNELMKKLYKKCY